MTPVWVNQSGIDRNTFVSVSSFIFQDFFFIQSFQGQLDWQSSPIFSRSIWATGQSEFKVTCNYLLGEKEMQELDTFDKISQRAISLVILSLVISAYDFSHIRMRFSTAYNLHWINTILKNSIFTDFHKFEFFRKFYPRIL